MDVKILAVAVVAIVLVAGGAVLLYDNDDDASAITIVDGSGKTISLDGPLTNVAVINSNVPKAMKMLGLDGAISCYHYTGTPLGIHAEELQGSQTDRMFGTYYTPSVETMIKYDVQAVICPVSSMTLNQGIQTACENSGIVVIRLACTGDTMLSDLEKLSKIFGDPTSATSKIDEYNNQFNSMMTAIESAISENSSYTNLDFLALMESKNAIYNTSSDLSKLFDRIFNVNVTSMTNLSLISVTNNAGETNTKEVIGTHMADIDVVLIRARAPTRTAPFTETTADSACNAFIGESLIVTTSSPAWSNDRVLVIDSALMSGLYSHIGLLIVLKQVYGISVDGYSDLNDVIADFQEDFKQSEFGNGSTLVAQYGASAPTSGTNVVLTYSTA